MLQSSVLRGDKKSSLIPLTAEIHIPKQTKHQTPYLHNLISIHHKSTAFFILQIPQTSNKPKCRIPIQTITQTPYLQNPITDLQSQTHYRSDQSPRTYITPNRRTQLSIAQTGKHCSKPPLPLRPSHPCRSRTPISLPKACRKLWVYF